MTTPAERYALPDADFYGDEVRLQASFAVELARWCRCARPHPARVYLGFRSCRACDRPIRPRIGRGPC